MEVELTNQILEGRSCGVTFEEFPYYLSDQTKALLTSAAFVYLKEEQFSKYTRNLSPASRAILLSGHAEPYNQMLAKALANYYQAKLLLLDATDLCLKLQRKRGVGSDSDLKSFSEVARERFSNLFESFSMLSGRSEQTNQRTGASWWQNNNPEARNRSSEVSAISAFEAGLQRGAIGAGFTNPASLKRTNSCLFDDKLLVQSLKKVLVSVSKSSAVILYLRDIEKLLMRGPKTSLYFGKMIKQLSGPILILGSRIMSPGWPDKVCSGETDEKVSELFPYTIDIRPPVDDVEHFHWKSKLEEDTRAIEFQDNRNHVSEVLAANDVECDDLGSISFCDTAILSNYIEEIVVSAISHHLMNTEQPNYRSGRLIISSQSLAHGLSIFRAGDLDNKDSLQDQSNGKIEAKMESPTLDLSPDGENTDPYNGDFGKKDDENTPGTPLKPEGPPDNDFEKRIRSEVIPSGKIGVTFDDIGALESVKESLQELVMLPLRRPNLFKGGLLKPCKGILLFGPPGTGKTMLAKALATEAKASFINVTMSTITSKWFGEDEKIVKALFTLAAKVSPTVIFIDEVDSMLGQRSRVGEHEAMRKIKNEFMAHWDGLLSKSTERILVLAATNRPFDLDEAIIRRFQRRIMVGLPNVDSREKILRTLLAKENLEEGFDFRELAIMTEGYTGSDLKNVCTEAAFRPIRELLKEEKVRARPCKLLLGANATALTQ
eukprot:TRINITY_DN5998_c0_g1_i5.p1 TRINITY_DN5998_c0_g1~~TRINITY_DN5998_c0_g1_i5.p1  ORF type:complete len:747 (-),score=94.06 TRINITY_DN5998_c0_g1_i5:647-2797(-)